LSKVGGGWQFANLFADRVFCVDKVELGLQVHPEFRLNLEPVPKAQGSITRYRTLARDDLADAVGRHVNLAGEYGGRHAQFRQFFLENSSRDPNYRPLRENLEILQGLELEDGGKIEIVPLPMPSPLFFDGERLPATYANFYVSNDKILVPVYNDPKDREALGVLSELFPARHVVGIDCIDLVWGFGAIHCMTKEEPLR